MICPTNMNELNLNSQWLPSVAAIDKLANNLIKPINDGEIDVIKAIATIRAVQEALDKVTNELKPLVINELHKYSSKEKIISHGTEFILKEAGVKYDYSKCGDTVWNNLDAEIKKLSEEKKEREKFLKSIKDMMIVVDATTGEVCEIKAPTKTSTTTYVVTFAKEVNNE